MKQLCEIIVRDVLPATRAMIAKRLAEKGLSGREIAEKMGVTPPAVTQYLNKTRGKQVLEHPDIKNRVDQFAEKLVARELSEKEKMREFCGLCKAIRENKLLCEKHLRKTQVKRCDLCLS